VEHPGVKTDIIYQRLKSKNIFTRILKNRLIERAEKLETFFNDPELPNHDKTPCTSVHHLVNELLHFGGKKI
jgi:hypothetical protein